MDSSPVLSTPVSGISLRSKWKFQTLAITPEDVRKKLFDLDDENDDQTHWSSSSEYFSQSLNDASCMSGTSQTNMFDEYSPDEQQKPQVNLSSEYVTLSPSPSKRPTTSLFNSFTPPPLLKRQRLFSPSSPTNPDKFPIDFQSPVRPSVSPNPYLGSSCDSLNEMAAKGDAMLSSPPRLERLQLFDYPRTPLSIARSSGLHVQLSSANVEPSLTMPQENGKMLQLHFRHATKRINRIKKRTDQHGFVRKGSRGTNINPFTPLERTRNMLRKIGDSNSSSIGTSTPVISKSEIQPHKKLALRESNISRYKEEFHEVCLIGSGSFGTVYKCINRLDGCVYALKRSHKPVVGSGDEPAVLREVCAHAVLGSHPHLVRYYSAWAEDDHMLIQNEFCDGGNLLSRIVPRPNGDVFDEGELKRLLRHISMGLQYIHSMGLVHLDIKPDNIFISSVHDAPMFLLPHDDSSDEAISNDMLAHRDWDTNQQFVYKIGDMGLVTSVSDPHVEEGDCRYLPRELLQESYSHLCKADVFSLGLTVYQAGSGAELPKNGDEWHRIRDGCLPSLQSCSAAFNELLQVMIHSDPFQRPAASELLSLSIICPATQKSKAQLCRELNEEKFKNEVLQRELRVAREQNSLSSSGDRSLLNGPRLNRSLSIA